MLLVDVCCSFWLPNEPMNKQNKELKETTSLPKAGFCGTRQNQKGTKDIRLNEEGTIDHGELKNRQITFINRINGLFAKNKVKFLKNKVRDQIHNVDF